MVGRTAGRWRQVIPPITGGLHCGYEGDQYCFALFKYSRRLPAGSIAARLRICLLPRSRVLFPPVTGGLHCGTDNLLGTGTQGVVFPSFSGGLHCGYGNVIVDVNADANSSRQLPAGSIAAPA